MYINVLNYGAVGDGITDDGPAFQAALAALASPKRGGRLYIPPRLANGTLAKYRIATPVTQDFGSYGPNGGSGDGIYILQADGAVILPDVGSAGDGPTNKICFDFANANFVLLENWHVYGVYPGFHDQGTPPPNCDIFIRSNGSNMRLYDCWFAGIVQGFDTSQPNYLTLRSVVCLVGSILSWHNMRIMACGPHHCVAVNNWNNIYGDGFDYYDFYDLDGNQYVPEHPDYCILIGGPHDVQSFSDRAIMLRNWTCDEGPSLAILARPFEYPNGNRIHAIELDGFNVLQNAGTRSNSFEFDLVDHVRLLNGYVQRGGQQSTLYSSNKTRSVSLTNIIVDSDSILGASSDGGGVDAKNCTKADGTPWGQTLFGCGASEIVVEQNGVRSLLTYTTANRPSAVGLLAGSSIFNSTTNMPNFADGMGNWRDATGNIV